MKLLLLTTFLLIFINNILCFDLMEDEICSQTKQVSKFWKCSLRKLPSYYKIFYIELADCIRIEEGIFERNDALAYFTCSDKSLLQKVTECFGIERLKPHDSLSKSDENKAADVFRSCSKRAFPDLD